MRDVDSYFESSPRSSLYHYTGIGALLGIAKSREIWAGNVRYMNDAGELSHALDMFEELVTVQLNTTDRGHPQGYTDFLHGLLTWIERQHEDPEHHLYVFSLSEIPSLLSQWRSYTPHGKGVSIGFPPSLLSTLTRDGAFKLGKCQYGADDKVRLINSLIEKLWVSCSWQDAQAPMPDQTRWKFTQIIDSYADSIFPILALAKHEAFAEEAEWRLISRHFTTLDNASFREGASMLVPYLSIPLENDQNVFDLILLGPTPHEEVSLPALRAFLKNEKLAAQVEATRIPYRVW